MVVMVVALSSPAEILRGRFDDLFPACTVSFFFKVEYSSRTPIPHILGQDQSTVAQRAETTVAECFLMTDV